MTSACVFENFSAASAFNSPYASIASYFFSQLAHISSIIVIIDLVNKWPTVTFACLGVGLSL